MVNTALVASLVVGFIGLCFMYGLKKLSRSRRAYGEPKRITWFEFGVAMVVLIALVIPIVLVVVKSKSVDATLKHYEWHDGVEVDAAMSSTECYAGTSGDSYSAGTSNCTHTYVSGSYSWTEEVRTPSCTTDSKGVQTCVDVITYIPHTAYIYTPYATMEFSYTLTSSYVHTETTYTYPGAYLATNPVPYGGMAIPGHIPRGAPADWREAKQRIDARNPRSVTDLFAYNNPILASEEETLAAYSPDVDTYLKKKLLPDHTAGILDNPIVGDSRKQARKASFVGVKVPDEQAVQESLMQFNAALGAKLQGDVHAVFIDSDLIDDPSGYHRALRAYWLGKHFGKYPLSKNGIILVIGTSGGKVDWAQMSTGMPFGNNVMIETAQILLPGKDLDPDVIFGSPRTIITPPKKEGEKAKVEIGFSSPRGVLEDVMLYDPATRFERSCMECEGEEDAGKVGYKDLIQQIEPSAEAKTWMVVIVGAISLIPWGIVAGTSFLERFHDWLRRHLRRKPKQFHR